MRMYRYTLNFLFFAVERKKGKKYLKKTYRGGGRGGKLQ
jgi:hypothetical protein